MSVNHYENFPVASILLPAHLRVPVRAIYAFARSADDLADEGNAIPEQRLAGLREYTDELNRIENGQTTHSALFACLAKIISTYRLPLQPLHDLLSAFSQDVVTTRYQNYPALLDYCRRSANPVGRLMLHLYGATDTNDFKESDAICTGLQLTNFWQDVALDHAKSRIYIPLEDLAQFGVTETHLAQSQLSKSWRALMQFEVERARIMLLSGAPLALRLPGRIGWELRLVIQGGLRILERIEAVDYDVFYRRPQLGTSDWVLMAWRAIRM